MVLLGDEPATLAATSSFCSDAFFFVPDAKLADYKAAPIWCDMEQRIFARSNEKTEVTIPADGNYTIAAPRMDQPMAIHDRETGATHDFTTDGDYTFLAKAGSHEDRFILMPASLPTGIASLQDAGIKLEVTDGGLNIAGLAPGMTANVYPDDTISITDVTRIIRILNHDAE